MPGDILRCSPPHLIALPCQTRAERAKAPSPVPRSISWQSFESNCDCSALRASASSEQSNCMYLPYQSGTLPQRVCVCALPCPGLALPLSSHRPRLETSLSPSLSHSIPVRTTPSPPPFSILQSPVSSLGSPPPPWVDTQYPFFLPLTSSRPGLC